MSKQISLKNLVMTNFGRHVLFEVEFSSHLTVIKGPNGSGKTTLLQAIFFCLFGSSSVDGTAKDLPRRGEKDCCVNLEMYIDGALCFIHRTMKDSFVTVDGETVATGHTSVNSWVEDALGVSQKVFKTLTYSEQTETAAIMSIGAPALNRMVEAIAEVDLVAAIENKSMQFEKEANAKLSVIEKPADIGELRTELTDVEAKLVGVGVKMKIADDEFAEAKAAVTKYLDQMAEANKSEQRRVKLISENTADSGKLIGREQQLTDAESDIGKITVSSEDLLTVTKQRDSLKSAVNALSAELSDIQAAARQAAQNQAWLTSNKAAYDSCVEYLPMLEPAKALYEECREIARDSAEAFRSAEKDVKAAREAVEGSVCKACKRPFDDADLNAARERLAEAQRECDTANMAMKESATKESEAQSALRNIEKLTAGGTAFVAQYESRLQQTETVSDRTETEVAEELDVLNAKREEANTSYFSIKHDLGQLESLMEKRAALSADIKELKSRIEERAAELETIPSIDLKEMGEKFSALDKDRSEKEAKHRELSDENKQLTGRQKQIIADIEKSEQLILRRAQLERRSANFDGLTKYLRSNRATFMSDMWEQLMRLTSEFVAQVTEGRIEAIGRTDGGDFYYIEDGHRMPYAKLAGGFKAVAGVGLRIALASLLPAGVSLVVLDEPSSELRDETAAALAGALRSTDRQIVLVTHRQGEEFASDAVVELTV